MAQAPAVATQAPATTAVAAAAPSVRVVTDVIDMDISLQGGDLLRAVMERQGFTVEPNEWWHFNYKDSPSYPILDISFQQATKR